MEEMLNFARRGREERAMYFVGCWGTLGSTARWPEVINLWEYESLHAMAKSFAFETAGSSMQDPHTKEFWDHVQKYRTGGFDRVLIPAPYAPNIRQISKNKRIIGAKVFYHERIKVTPGQAKSYLSMLEQEWLPVARELGMELLGAYKTAMRNDSECIVIWAIREWEDWAKVEMANETSARVATWRRRTNGVALDWMTHLMCSAARSTTQTGKIL
jgi:hypothetical protein